MNQRNQLGYRAEDYLEGRYDGFEAGRKYERDHIRRVEWSKLFGVVVAGAFTAHLLFNVISMIV